MWYHILYFNKGVNDTMIYFVQGGTQLFVKIGHSVAENLKRRLTNIQGCSPEPLRLIAVIDGDRRDEKELHRRFEHHRQHGEWFSPGDDLMNYISTSQNVIDISEYPYPIPCIWRGGRTQLISKQQADEMVTLRKAGSTLEQVALKLKVSKASVVNHTRDRIPGIRVQADERDALVGLRKQGLSLREIARRTRRSRNTVARQLKVASY